MCLLVRWMIICGAALGGLIPESVLPLHTEGNLIVGANGKPIALACANWYGAHLKQMASNGLDKKKLDGIAAQVVALGFNCIRLPFSLELIFTNRTEVPLQAKTLAANPDLWGLRPLAVFDRTVAALASHGIAVILNNHVSAAGWCCTDDDGEGLWFTEEYPEAKWIIGLRVMAERYRNNSLVVGFDLRNELRRSSLGTPTWGSGDPTTDWSMAAIRGGLAVSQVNPSMLIIVEAVNYAICWTDISKRPIHADVPALKGRTVYSAHEYPWSSIRIWVRLSVGVYLLGILCVLGLALLATGVEYSLRLCGCLDAISASPCTPTCRIILLLLAVLSQFAVLLICIVAWYVMPCTVAAYIRMFACIVLPMLPSWAIWACVFCAWSRASIVDITGRRRRVLVAVEQDESDAGDMSRLDEDDSDDDVDGAAESKSKQVFAPFLPSCCLWSMAAILTVGLVLFWWVLGTYWAYAMDLDKRWGFVGKAGVNGVPVWLGEFGTDVQSVWWRYLLRYVRERQFSWAYWSFNGEKRVGELESYGVVGPNMTVQNQWLLRDLQKLMQSTFAP